MEPNENLRLISENVPAKKSVPDKTPEFFIEEKKQILKKNAKKRGQEPPAPFYDELHFANYE